MLLAELSPHLPPFQLVWLDIYRDGGTIGISVVDAKQNKHDFTVDRQYHRLFYGATHPDDSNSIVFVDPTSRLAVDIIDSLRRAKGDARFKTDFIDLIINWVGAHANHIKQAGRARDA